MKNFILLIFSILFLNSACKKANFITLHAKITEKDIAELKWVLRVTELDSSYIEFEIIETKEINNGLFDLLNKFEKKVNYADFVELKGKKKMCRLKSNSTNEFEIGNYYFTKVYRNQKEVFFSKKNFHKISDLINHEKTIELKLSGLSSMGWVIEKQLKLTYKTSLNEVETIGYLMNNNKSFENFIISKIKTEFRSIVGGIKKENIDTTILQTNLTKKLKTELKGVSIIDLELRN